MAEATISNTASDGLSLNTSEGDTLTPDDAVDVLEELLPAQNKSYELGLKLKLPQHVVHWRPSTRHILTHVVACFTF